MNRSNALEELEKTITERKTQMPAGSYTTSLFERGENTMIKKLGEEFAEMIVEFSKTDRERMISETVDLLFHLLVLLNLKEISLEDIYEEILRRKK